MEHIPSYTPTGELLRVITQSVTHIYHTGSRQRQYHPSYRTETYIKYDHVQGVSTLHRYSGTLTPRKEMSKKTGRPIFAGVVSLDLLSTFLFCVLCCAAVLSRGVRGVTCALPHVGCVVSWGTLTFSQVYSPPRTYKASK